MSRPSADELLELISVLAHDLRTPLTPVKGYAEILRSRPGIGPAKTEQYAGIVVEAAARMERSVDMLSGIAALHAGRGQVRNEAVDAAVIIAERLDLWRGRLPARTFAGHTGSAPGVMLVDRGWIGRALDVLIEQATRLWPPPAVISMRAVAGPAGDTVRLTVGDLMDEDAAPAVSRDSDALGRAFVNAVCDACGYQRAGDLEIDVPIAAPV
ncbi:MAG: histidine kinase dimerization/phospho-acceptor domain-containing protein [Mycobacteriales bacterium]